MLEEIVRCDLEREIRRRAQSNALETEPIPEEESVDNQIDYSAQIDELLTDVRTKIAAIRRPEPVDPYPTVLEGPKWKVFIKRLVRKLTWWFVHRLTILLHWHNEMADASIEFLCHSIRMLELMIQADRTNMENKAASERRTSEARQIQWEKTILDKEKRISELETVVRSGFFRQGEQQRRADEQNSEIIALKHALEETNVRLEQLESTSVRLNQFEESSARLDQLEEASARLDQLEEASARLDQLEEASVRLDQLEEASARLDQLEEASARLNQLEEASARLDQLEATSARLDQLEATSARFEELERDEAARRAEAERYNIDNYVDYIRFENIFRGSEEEIKKRVERYLQYFLPGQRVLDLGCGHGEWLQVLTGFGVRAKGVDMNRGCVEICQVKQLDAEQSDMFAYLEKQEDASLDGITALQVIEHITPGQLGYLLQLCRQKLRTGGVLILETPNPAVVYTILYNFYVDPTHIRPVDPRWLKYLVETSGFGDVLIDYPAYSVMGDFAQPRFPALDNQEDANRRVDFLNNMLFGATDYAVIARKG